MSTSVPTPLTLPKIVKDEQHVPAVTAGQVNKLVSESNGDEQALYVIAAATGMRIGESSVSEHGTLSMVAALSRSSNPLIVSVAFRASRHGQRSATSR
jgi:hypothetical protein